MQISQPRNLLSLCLHCLSLPVVSHLVFDPQYLLDIHLKRRVSWVIPHPAAHFHLIQETSRRY